MCAYDEASITTYVNAHCFGPDILGNSNVFRQNVRIKLIIDFTIGSDLLVLLYIKFYLSYSFSLSSFSLQNFSLHFSFLFLFRSLFSSSVCHSIVPSSFARDFDRSFSMRYHFDKSYDKRTLSTLNDRFIK